MTVYLFFGGAVKTLIGWDLFFFYAFFYRFRGQGVQDAGGGDEQKHSPHTHKAAADDNGHENQQGRQAHAAAHHMGVYKVVFNLLYYQEHYKEPYSLYRVFHGYQEYTDACAHKGAENRYKGGDRNDSAHQHRIGEAENRHCYYKQHTQYHRLKTLAGQKAGKSFVAQAGDIKYPLGAVVAEKGQHHIFGRGANFFLAHNQVNGKDK